MEKTKTTYLDSQQKTLAWFLIFIFSTSILYPTYTFAGGPDQPEVHGFTPIGVSDMVDPFTGDFTYNIPLMEIEGYPLNIVYNSGVTMDQEASWVGLGWSLHTGSLNRAKRGIPDDFKTDEISKTVSMKPITNIGVDVGASFELIGYDPKDLTALQKDNGDTSKLKLNVGLGVNFNSHNGFGARLNFGPAFQFGKSSDSYYTAGFSLSGSSENGASFSPSLSMDKMSKKSERKMDATIGLGMNSRSGLEAISFKGSALRKSTKIAKYNQQGVRGSASYDIGLQSYTPSPSPSFTGLNLTASIAGAVSLFGADAQGNTAITYSRQWIPKDKKTIVNKSYGYMHSRTGEEDSEALLDFNRDNDGSFTKYSQDLPSTFQTYDVFSINAQGTGGSFRPIRNDVGFVFDPRTKVRSFMGSFGAEVGGGGAFDLSFDIVLGTSKSTTGVWHKKNDVKKLLSSIGPYKLKPQESKLINAFSMVEANERSVENNGLVNGNFGGDKPVHYALAGQKNISAKLSNRLEFDENAVLSTKTYANKRTSRLKTNNQMYFLSNYEVATGLGVEPQNPLLYSLNKGHHIGEITQMGTDGRRYIFGLPAYNYIQEDITFAIGSPLYGNANGIAPDSNDESFVHVSNFDFIASEDNNHGIDGYFSSMETPPYAHSFMLTSILSDDYIDADSIQGPSKNDLGNYIKFTHTRISNHKWRAPLEKDKAFFNDGMLTNDNDDKGSVIRGVKDIIYTKTIESKNQILVFVLGDRNDGKSIGENGGFESANSQKKLDSIYLFNLKDYDQNGMNALALQTVTFAYTYELCASYPANEFSTSTDSTISGKLTLKGIKFSYQGSNKMRDRNYDFSYLGVNPSYNLKAVDRWGTYKENHPANIGNMDYPSPNAEFPYANQDIAQANIDASAWHLTNITLPSGGKIKVTYEADDYGFVQHKKAARMYEIVGTEIANLDSAQPEEVRVSKDGPDFEDFNQSIFFKFSDPSHKLSDYAKKGDQLYFRCLVDFKAPNAQTGNECEYVSGYAKITKLIRHDEANGNTYGEVFLEPEKLKDNGSKKYSPITKAAIQFGRIHLARYINDSPALSAVPNGESGGFYDFLDAAASAAKSLPEQITGPNLPIYKAFKGVDIITKKSFIRLMEPTGTKLGGGSRVAKIEMSDEWDQMGTNSDGYTYGQEYTYETEDGKSSGVASYEPVLGGDENPFRTAYVVNNKKFWATDDQLFVENPIMESQFPNPQVGYSRVEIKNISRPGVVRTATGKVVKEFYTAREFPTIVKNSNIHTIPVTNLLPIGPKYQKLTATQGFVIELNDMHGKPWKEKVYAEGATQPMSSVTFNYQKTPLNLDGKLNWKLDNKVTAINKNGVIENPEIGVRYDAVADFRESDNQSTAVKSKLGVNGILLFGVIPIPSWWPKLDRSRNRFRSATLNKTINRFGILSETIANQDGSIVSTKNKAYDAESGAVLLTETKTNFEDNIYSLDYPAYWNYDAFGRASNNVLFEYKAPKIYTNGFVPIPPHKNHFAEGDELALTSSTGLKVKAWVTEKRSDGIIILDKSGQPLSGNNIEIKVIRSGYRNKQGTSMASLVSLNNPLNAIKTNSYENVLNASAIVYSDKWKTYCSCFNDGVNATTNPYILGTKGNLRPLKSYTYLSERTQSNYNGNTNIRKDGVFEGYNPFYRLESGKWGTDGENWTYVSEVTQFSPNGQTLETKDALGRHSTNAYGFNGTLTTGTAVNAKLTDFAVAGLEDADQNSCNDESFFSKKTDGNSPSITNEGHTGRKSIEVAPNSTVSFQNIKDPCTTVPRCQIFPEFKPSSNITFDGAELPVSIEVLSSNGGVAYMISANELEYSFSNSTNPDRYITIKVKDEKGCEKVFTLYPIEAGNAVLDGGSNINMITGTQSIRYKAPDSTIEMNINQ